MKYAFLTLTLLGCATIYRTSYVPQANITKVTVAVTLRGRTLSETNTVLYSYAKDTCVNGYNLLDYVSRVYRTEVVNTKSVSSESVVDAKFQCK